MASWVFLPQCVNVDALWQFIETKDSTGKTYHQQMGWFVHGSAGHMRPVSTEQVSGEEWQGRGRRENSKQSDDLQGCCDICIHRPNSVLLIPFVLPLLENWIEAAFITKFC